MTDLDRTDRKLLNLIQADFPLSERPYDAIGRSLGMAEAEVMERIGRLRDDGIIRRISAIFDTRALGYDSSLVAMRIGPDRLDEAAEAVNSHPGVSHNYGRNNRFNLWFTIAVPPDSRLGLGRTIDALGRLAGADATLLLPTLKLYKIGVKLDMIGDGESADASEEEFGQRREAEKGGLTPLDMELVRQLQRDLPVAERPFDPMAAALGLDASELIAHGERLIRSGRMRRYAAVLRHREAGFTANAMGVWKVGEDRVDEVGQVMAGFSFVSHCYRRPTYPDWPYSLFTMVHGRSESECENMLRTISQKTGVSDYASIYSVKEYKKVRVQYFTADLHEWEARLLKDGGGEADGGSKS